MTFSGFARLVELFASAALLLAVDANAAPARATAYVCTVTASQTCIKDRCTPDTDVAQGHLYLDETQSRTKVEFCAGESCFEQARKGASVRISPDVVLFSAQLKDSRTGMGAYLSGMRERDGFVIATSGIMQTGGPYLFMGSCKEEVR